MSKALFTCTVNIAGFLYCLMKRFDVVLFTHKVKKVKDADDKNGDVCVRCKPGLIL